MADEYAIFVEGLSGIEDLENLPNDIARWASMAVNKTADRFRKRSQDDMMQEVAFSASYLRQRLTVTKRANRASLEAVISGRDRPTSLARFVTRGKVRQQGVDLTVEPGKGLTLDRAFLIQLKNGNRGLAVRLPAGQSMRNTRKAKKLGDNLYLLYGPSVDQVFKGVAADEGPKALAYLESEFLRLQSANI